MKTSKLAAYLAFATASVLEPSIASATPGGTTASQCFNIRDWNGWSVSPDAKSMYIRIGVRTIYHVRFSGTCSVARSIGAHVVTSVRGSTSICGPLDLDIRFAEGRGFAVPFIVSEITPLSPEDAAALPKTLRP